MLTNTPAIVRLLTLCRDAAAREGDSDTFAEANGILNQIGDANWIMDKEQHDAAMAAAEAKALVIIEAYVTVMNEQLQDQGL